MPAGCWDCFHCGQCMRLSVFWPSLCAVVHAGVSNDGPALARWNSYRQLKTIARDDVSLRDGPTMRLMERETTEDILSFFRHLLCAPPRSVRAVGPWVSAARSKAIDDTAHRMSSYPVAPSLPSLLDGRKQRWRCS